MKRKSFILCLGLSVGLSAFIGCVRDGDNISNPVEVSVAAENPPLDDTDKTDVCWSEGSMIGVFAYSRTNERWEFGNNSCFALTETDGPRGSFRGNLYLGAYIDDGEVHEITYLAYYPYRKYSCTNGVFAVTIPDVQYPSADSFDPEADFLIGSVLEANAPLGLMDVDGEFAPLHFGFTRSVVPIKLYINDIPVEQQKIEKIVFRIEGADLAGRVRVDLRDSAFMIDENESSDSITLVYRNDEILAEGFNAWCSICPATARYFSLLIETEDYLIATDVDAGENIGFAAGCLTCIPVSLSSAAVTPKPKPVQGAVFHEVSSRLDDFSGRYIIACNDRAMGTDLSSQGYNIPGIDISAMKTAAGSYVFPDGEPGFVYTIAKLDGIAPADGYSFNYAIYNEAFGYVRTDEGIAGRIIASPGYGDEFAKWDLRLSEADGKFDITNPKKLTKGNYFLRWDESKNEFAAFTGTTGSKIGLFRLSENR